MERVRSSHIQFGRESSKAPLGQVHAEQLNQQLAFVSSCLGPLQIQAQKK
jgi:hypothetical protein